VQIASEVAESYNHQFYIAVDNDNNNQTTLFLIDKANNPASSTEIDEDEIVWAEYVIGFPIAGVNTSYNVVEIQTGKVTEYEEAMRVENKPIGQEVFVRAFADTYGDRSQVSTLLTALKNNIIKSQASMVVPDIQFNYRLGDRFKFGREIDFINTDLIARSITYDFGKRTTKVSGDATLSTYTRDLF